MSAWNAFWAGKAKEMKAGDIIFVDGWKLVLDQRGQFWLWVGDALVPLSLVETNIGVRIDPEADFVYALRAWRETASEP